MRLFIGLTKPTVHVRQSQFWVMYGAPQARRLLDKLGAAPIVARGKARCCNFLLERHAVTRGATHGSTMILQCCLLLCVSDWTDQMRSPKDEEVAMFCVYCCKTMIKIHERMLGTSTDHHLPLTLRASRRKSVPGQLWPWVVA